MNLDNLEILGLSKGQISVYGAILELGNTGLNKIQEKTGIERRNIYDIINKLIEKGLVTYTLEKGKRTYQVTHPKKISDEIKVQQEKLKALKNQMPQIKGLFDISSPDIRAEVYRGNEAIKSLISETLDYKESYWMGGNAFENYTAVTKGLLLWWDSYMKKRVEQKHIMYDLVDYKAKLKGLDPKNIKAHKKNYYKYCQLPKGFNSPMVTLIFGNKVAQILWQKQPFAFVLESKKIKESHMKYFNYFWKNPW